jgi:PII-like signaling protein
MRDFLEQPHYLLARIFMREDDELEGKRLYSKVWVVQRF